MYVQIRRGGFQTKPPWGEKSFFENLIEAKEHISNVAKMADNYNCVLDYLITDDHGNIIEGVEYTKTSGFREPYQVTDSIESYLYDEILCEHDVRLEDQPRKVTECIGRLIEKLLEKSVFNLDDLKYIADSRYGAKTDSLKLVE